MNANRNDTNDNLRKTPIQWAVVNKDKSILALILQKEHEFHEDDKSKGLQCLKSQLTQDEDLKSIIKQFQDLYKKTAKEKFVAGLLAIIPILISFGTYFFDVFSDGTLSSDYYRKSQELLQNNTMCSVLTLKRDDYKVAFATNVLLIIIAIVPSYLIVLSQLRYPYCVFFILTGKFFERLTFYGIGAILSLYFKKSLGFSEDTATSFYHAFICICTITPIVGGVLADQFLGKFKTILHLSFICIIGCTLTTLATIPSLGLDQR